MVWRRDRAASSTRPHTTASQTVANTSMIRKAIPGSMPPG